MCVFCEIRRREAPLIDVNELGSICEAYSSVNSRICRRCGAYRTYEGEDNKVFQSTFSVPAQGTLALTGSCEECDPDKQVPPSALLLRVKEKGCEKIREF